MCGMRKKATVEEAGQMSGKPNPASRASAAVAF